MTALEIVLLIIGALVMAAGFLIPVRSEEATEDVKALVEKQVKESIGAEIDSLRGHVDDVVDEAVEYAREKTERSLERISNEKIMAINEYSETVLDEINKNHKEVMFLYDMLNDKQETLKQTLEDAGEAAKVMEEKAEEVRAAAEEASAAPAPAKKEKVVTPAFTGLTGKSAEGGRVLNTPPAVEEMPNGKKVRTLNWAAAAEAEAGGVPVQEADTAPADAQIDNAEGELPQFELHRRILVMHEEGMDSVSIAKQLHMGVGEVDLIIGLHGGKGI
jgi:hypothetical protein